MNIDTILNLDFGNAEINEHQRVYESDVCEDMVGGDVDDEGGEEKGESTLPSCTTEDPTKEMMDTSEETDEGAKEDVFADQLESAARRLMDITTRLQEEFEEERKKEEGLHMEEEGSKEVFSIGFLTMEELLCAPYFRLAYLRLFFFFFFSSSSFAFTIYFIGHLVYLYVLYHYDLRVSSVHFFCFNQSN